MSNKKDQIFTMAVAFDIIKSAISKISDCNTANTDVIIFNNLNKAITKKGVK